MRKTEAPAVRLPEAFLDKMRRLLGEEYEAFVQSYESERVQGLRFNTLKGPLGQLLETCKEDFGLQQVPWCAEGFYYGPDRRPGLHPFHEAGLYYIQEPSAMAAVSLLDPKPGDFVLDLCAAPGGKTTHIAERLCGRGLLVSNEIHPARAKILSQNMERMGICNGVVTSEAAGRLKSFFPEFFDRIVVDAPCSGEGMFRKDEQARAQWSEDHVRMCAGRQQEILDHAADMLKPGGRMVYSTCTFSPEENEAGIAAFLGRHPEFSVVRVPDGERLPGLVPGRAEWARVSGEMERWRETAFTFRIWPHLARGEGHYLALLQKCPECGPSPAESLEIAGKRRREKAGQPGCLRDKMKIRAVRECLEEILDDNRADENRLVLFGDQVYQLPEGMPPFDGLRLLRPGLQLGTLKKNRMEPAHALAMALRPDQVKESLQLHADSAEAAAYLRGAALRVDERLKGWVLVCVGEYSVGWGKAAVGVLKNHYPKGLRLH